MEKIQTIILHISYDDKTPNPLTWDFDEDLDMHLVKKQDNEIWLEDWKLVHDRTVTVYNEYDEPIYSYNIEDETLTEL